MPDSTAVALLVIGFLLGARHALDADHVAAILTLLVRRPGLRTSGLAGLSWGAGHTCMLLAVGLAMLGFRLSIPSAVEPLFEGAVGVMLVGLGASLGWTLVRDGWHVHHHEHDGSAHAHLHSHRLDAGHDRHPHWTSQAGRPFLIGMVHGLAGSGAVVLAIVSASSSVVQGLAYIVAFGCGSILGMVALGLLMSVPLTRWQKHGGRLPLAVQGMACAMSVGLGLWMLGRVVLGTGGS